MQITEIKKILQCDQSQLLDYIISEINKYKFKKVIATDEYLYAVGNIPILLVAHLDIVHKNPPVQIFYDAQKKVMWSPTGVGGDDRCGVIAIIELLRKGYLPSVLFTTNEEVGCLGAISFCRKEKLNKVRFALEIDRRGNNQAVFYDCANKSFQDYIINNFGFDLQYGTFTDVSKIGEAFNIAIVNVSAGYYNEHTCIEFINLKNLALTIQKVQAILEDKDKTYYDYQKKVYPVNYYGNWNNWYKKDNKKNDGKERLNTWRLIIEDWKDLDEEEWKEYYGFDKPKNKADVYKTFIELYQKEEK